MTGLAYILVDYLVSSNWSVVMLLHTLLIQNIKRQLLNQLYHPRFVKSTLILRRCKLLMYNLLRLRNLIVTTFKCPKRGKYLIIDVFEQNHLLKWIVLTSICIQSKQLGIQGDCPFLHMLN